MQRRCWPGVLLLLCTLAGSVSGQVRLQWKLKEGDQLFLEEKSVVAETIKFMGKDYPEKLTHSRVTRFSVLKENDDRSLVLEQKILKVRVQRGEKKQGGGADLASAKLLQDLQGATFKITLNRKMRVIKFEGYEALMKKMAGNEDGGKKEEVGKQARALITRESLSRPTEALFAFLPDMAVAKGDEWTSESVRPLGALGLLQMTDSYTYKADEEDQGDDKKIVKLEVANSKTTFLPSEGGGGLAFRVIKGNFKVDQKKTHGTISFSAAKGRVMQAKHVTHLTGTLTVDAMGNMISMDIDHEETVTSKWSSKNPLK
jgi:hypothetical protein